MLIMHNNVLVCKPGLDGFNLAAELSKYNIQAYHFPTIKISYLDYDNDSIRLSIESSTDIIFTSKNAVRSIFNSSNNYDFLQKRCWAIGYKTSLEMKEKLSLNSKYPENSSSESLIALIKNNNLNPLNSKFLLITGDGGRDFLAQEISKNYSLLRCNVYKRINICTERYIFDHRGFLNTNPKIIIFTNIDSLKYFLPVCRYNNELFNATITVTSKSMAMYAKKCGFKKIERLLNFDNKNIINFCLTFIKGHHDG